MLKRKKDQSRYEFEITGVTNEICFSDLAKEGKDGAWIPFEAEDPTWEEPFTEVENAHDGIVPSVNPMHLRVRAELDRLSPRHQDAVFHYLEGKTERNAAKAMDISQPWYHEMLHGKNGVGGIFNHLRKMIGTNFDQKT